MSANDTGTLGGGEHPEGSTINVVKEEGVNREILNALFETLLGSQRKISSLQTYLKLLDEEGALMSAEVKGAEECMAKNEARCEKKVKELNNLRATSWKITTWTRISRNAANMRALERVIGRLGTIVDKNALELKEKTDEQRVVLRMRLRVTYSLLAEQNSAIATYKSIADAQEEALLALAPI